MNAREKEKKWKESIYKGKRKNEKKKEKKKLSTKYQIDQRNERGREVQFRVNSNKTIECFALCFGHNDRHIERNVNSACVKKEKAKERGDVIMREAPVKITCLLCTARFARALGGAYGLLCRQEYRVYLQMDCVQNGRSISLEMNEGSEARSHALKIRINGASELG